MSSLICGSLAYDTIMNFAGSFRDQILPDQIHILNVSFLVPEMRREFGGCAGNIAYSLKLLGGDPLIMATVGNDAQPYLDRLTKLGLTTTYIQQIDHGFTAQAMITTDVDNNQITAFHPGAMTHSHLNRVSDAAQASLGIVAPDGRDGMMQHAQQFAEAGIPFIFDPGQGLPMFNGEELLTFIDMADYVAVNDYEAKMLINRTGLSIAQIAQRVRALVVTLGAAGSEIHTAGNTLVIPPVQPGQIVDPTGCGDAFRGGLLYGIEQGFDWETTGRLASLMGAIKIAHQGPQNHTLSQSEIAKQFTIAFGYTY